MKPDPDRQALIDQMTERFRKKLEAEYTDDNATLEQIEEAVDRVGQDVLPELQKQWTNKRGKKPRDNQTTCSCGAKARYRGLETKTLVTRHGLLPWTRPTYYCSACRKGLAPLDTTLGLDRGDTTPAVRQWIALLAPKLGFAETTTVLSELCGIALSAATVERIAVHVGTSLRDAQHAEAALHHADRLPDRRTPCPSHLYIGADGLMVPLREAWKKDGSLGDLQCRYGECKTGVVYTTATDANGRDSRVLTHSYTATFEGVERFELLLGTLAHRCGHHAAKQVIVLGDGAVWIWLMLGRLFPGAIQILDFYHACEHLAKVADAIYGKDTDLSRQWQKARQAELKANGVSAVVEAIAAWHPESEAHRDLQRVETGYFRDNAERMRYQTYLEKGYHIGSGVVEATCKHVVAQRLDQAGMHWRMATAEAIATLRAAQLSTLPTDLRPHLRMDDAPKPAPGAGPPAVPTDRRPLLAKVA